MSLKHNILANYASQIYVTFVGIAIVPLYFKYMGAETYGLVGFYALLQAWFNVLDIGLTPTIAREAARYRGGAMDALTFRRLLRSLEGVFLAVAVFGCGVLLSISKWMSTRWLNVRQLSTDEVTTAIQMMSVIIAMRWMSGLYRGQIRGAEHLVWLSGYNSLIATIRFAGVMFVLIFISIAPTAFFTYQLCVAILELAVLMIMAYRLLPPMPQGEPLPWSWAPLRPVLKFSLTIAFSSTIWIVATQADKLVLSTILPLAEYGYFTLAALVAGGVMIISNPVSGAIMPRMARLNAEGNDVELINLYRKATQLVGIVAIPAALVLALFAEQVLWAWTGNAETAQKAAIVLTLYALGNALLALGAFSYYLQFSTGLIRLHPIGTGLYVAVLLPSVVWAASNYGIYGTGFAWLGTNALFFLFWIPVVHRQFGRKLHAQWLRDLSGIAFMSAVGGLLFVAVLHWPAGRFPVAIRLVIVSFVMLVLAALGSSVARKTISLKWCGFFPGVK